MKTVSLWGRETSSLGLRMLVAEGRLSSQPASSAALSQPLWAGTAPSVPNRLQCALLRALLLRACWRIFDPSLFELFILFSGYRRTVKKHVWSFQETLQEAETMRGMWTSVCADGGEWSSVESLFILHLIFWSGQFCRVEKWAVAWCFTAIRYTTLSGDTKEHMRNKSGINCSE